MPVVKEVNFKGEVIGQVELSDAVFGAPVHVPAMHRLWLRIWLTAVSVLMTLKIAEMSAAAVKSPGDRSIQDVHVQAAHAHLCGLAAE